MTLDRIEYYRSNQGRGVILCHPSQFDAEVLRLRLDPDVTLPTLQEVRIAHRRRDLN